MIPAKGPGIYRCITADIPNVFPCILFWYWIFHLLRLVSTNSRDKHGERLKFMYFACKNTENDSKVWCALIGQKNTNVFCHQSETRTAATVCNWSGKTLSPEAVLSVLLFSSRHFFRPFRLSLAPGHYMPPGLRECLRLQPLKLYDEHLLMSTTKRNQKDRQWATV